MSISEDELFQRARDGDNEAVAELLQLHRPRLRKMVAARLNPRIRGRLDESDVIQEAYLEAAKKLPEYLSAPRAPFFLWLRKITSYKIIDAHRRHLVGEGRDAEREVRLNQGRTQMASSIFLAANLMGNLTTPSQALIKLETQAAIHECIDKMDPIDREILALRHFEELTNQEAALELGIEPAAASKRFIRSLQRLQKTLDESGLALENS